jgi:hypothetical protein
MEQIRNAIAAKMHLINTFPRMATKTSGKKVEKRKATITLAILSQLLQAGRELQVCIEFNSRPRLQLVLRRHTNVVRKP